MRILIIAEHDGKSLKPATLNTVAAAQQIATFTSGKIDVCLLGERAQGAADQAAGLIGIDSVLWMNDGRLNDPLAEREAKAIMTVASDYGYILAPSTTFGKNVMPRVAALLDVMQISDVMKIHSADTFDRPIYAGNAIATVQSQDKVKVMTIRPTAFTSASLGGTGVPVMKRDLSGVSLGESQSTYGSLEASKSERPELTSARIVVSGGRALSSKENFAIIEEFADCLKAAVGASRAAVDAGFVPNDYQVGQTGKVVAPELYIAVGISGAIQHLAGMKDSKTIIAINKDPDAPIFQIADYGYVGDLFEVIPQLTREICGDKTK